jgi:hypothetical protein
MTDEQNTARATLASPAYPRGPKVAQNLNNAKHDKRRTSKECHADTRLSANNNEQPTTNHKRCNKQPSQNSSLDLDGKRDYSCPIIYARL